MSMSQNTESGGGTNLDGVYILAEILRRGLPFERLPGQMLIVWDPREPSRRTAFVHSVPQSTRIASVSYLQEKRFRRSLMTRAGVPVPPGASFSFSSEKDPVRFASRIGYPVVVKELFGSNPSFATYDVRDDETLRAAVARTRSHLPTKDPDAPSYAQTINLSTAEEVDGELLKSPRSRFLIEKQVAGTSYRVYVVAERARHALVHVEGEWQTESSPDPTLTDLAERAVSGVSGIESATVDLVQTSDGVTYLTELCERLVLPHSTSAVRRTFEQVAGALIYSELHSAGFAPRSDEALSAPVIIDGGLPSDPRSLGPPSNVRAVAPLENKQGGGTLTLHIEPDCDPLELATWLDATATDRPIRRIYRPRDGTRSDGPARIPTP